MQKYSLGDSLVERNSSLLTGPISRQTASKDETGRIALKSKVSNCETARTLIPSAYNFSSKTSISISQSNTLVPNDQSDFKKYNTSMEQQQKILTELEGRSKNISSSQSSANETIHALKSGTEPYRSSRTSRQLFKERKVPGESRSRSVSSIVDRSIQMQSVSRFNVADNTCEENDSVKLAQEFNVDLMEQERLMKEIALSKKKNISRKSSLRVTFDENPVVLDEPSPDDNLVRVDDETIPQLNTFRLLPEMKNRKFILYLQYYRNHLQGFQEKNKVLVL